MKTVVALPLALLVFLSGPNLVFAKWQEPGGNQQAVATNVEGSKSIASLFAEIWEDRLKHAPEYASTLGDARYDDQL